MKDPSLRVEAILRGSYSDLCDNNEDNPCNLFTYWLFDVTLVNNTNGPVKFLTYTCSTAYNVVTDSKDIMNCINICTNNTITTITLKPNQEFYVPVILKMSKPIPKIKLGFIFLTMKDVRIDNVLSTLTKCNETLENVLWSTPIQLGHELGAHYEIH